MTEPGKMAASSAGELFKQLEGLCDPSLHSLEEAEALARELMQQNQFLDAKLVRWLLHISQTETFPRRMAHAIRALDLLAAIADQARIMPYLVQLLRSPDPNLRSKVVLVIGRGSRNANWAENRIGEPDPRVRANAVESLWEIPSERSRALLWSMVEDPNNRVAGNAIVGLHRLGESGSVPLLLNMSEHRSARFRATAAWAMGVVRDPRFVPVLARMVRDPKEVVRRNVFRALLAIRHRVKAAGEAGALDVLINAFDCLPDGSRRLRVTVTLGNGEGMAERLAATAFIIRENGRLVSRYGFDRDARFNKLAVGIALPCGTSSAEFRRWAQQALFACLERKRTSDMWSVLRYADNSIDAGEDMERRGATGAARRSADRAVLHRELVSQRPSVPPDAGALGGLQALIRDVGELPGIRHIILFVEAGERPVQAPGAEIAAVADMARASGVSAHIIMPEGSHSGDWFQKVRRCTRGSAFTVSTEAETASACSRIFSRLLNSYEILYSPDDSSQRAEACEVTVEVFGDLGRGEVSFSAPVWIPGDLPPVA